MGILERRQQADETWQAKVDRELTETFDALTQHESLLNQGQSRMTEIEEKLDANNEMTARIDANTAELLAIFAAVKGFAKVGGWVGEFLKWATAILIGVGLLVYFFKTGDLPKKP